MTAERFWAQVDKTGGCWLWQGHRQQPGKRGLSYGRVGWGGKQRLAHRVAYELTHGAIPGHLLVRHTCDNPICMNPEHLVLGTHADNIADRDRRGRTATGRRNGRHTKPDNWTSRKIKNL